MTFQPSASRDPHEASDRSRAGQHARGATAQHLASQQSQSAATPPPAMHEPWGAATAWLPAAQYPRGASTARPPAQLSCRRASGPPSVLIEGGSPEGRLQLARALHREGADRAGEFIRLDCGRDERAATESLEEFLCRTSLVEGRAARAGMSTREAGSTLFLDSIAQLSPRGQRLLFALATPALDAAGQPRRGQVIAGSRVDLAGEVTAGRFLGPLYQFLRARRIQLEPAPV